MEEAVRVGAPLPQPHAERRGERARDPTIAEPEDFGEALTPELRAKEDALRAEVERRQQTS